MSCRGPGGNAASRPAVAKSNTVCYECHIDFKGEELTAVHEKAEVFCVRCHGRSQAHMEDEVRATPADVTFRKKAMKVFCLTCHEPARYRQEASHAAEEAKSRDATRRSCMDCHGEHELVRLDEAKADGAGK